MATVKTSRAGIVILNSTESILFLDDISGVKLFVPHSIMETTSWWFTLNPNVNDYGIHHLQRNDEITICIPNWLLDREGIF